MTDDKLLIIESERGALVEMHYLPNLSYFALLARYKTVWIEAHENYQKRSYRNRCHIASANGILRLSIPLKKGKNERQPITDVAISYDENWQRQHWESITSAYQNAPFFDYYAPQLLPFYQQQYPLLFDFSRSLLQELILLLQIEVQLKETTTYNKSADVLQDDFRNKISPKMPPASNLPEYVQVFMEKHGFLPNLSILDLLFCTGPQAGLLLEG